MKLRYLLTLLTPLLHLTAQGQVLLTETPHGYVQLTGSHIGDSTGALEHNGTILFSPVSATGAALSYRVGSAGGQVVDTPVRATVTNGVFAILIADTALTAPANVCFAVTVIDNVSGKSILGPGYSCLQPAGSGVAVTGSQAWCTTATDLAGGSCNFDEYTPNLAALLPTTFGPPPNIVSVSVTTGTSLGGTWTGCPSACQLNLVITAGMNYRGLWAASTAYNPGDIVLNAGTLYVAPAAFTSGSTFNVANWNAYPSSGLGVGVSASDPGQSAYYDQTGALIKGNVPANCAAYSAFSDPIQACFQRTQYALIPPATSGTTLQGNAYPAQTSCVVDNTTNAITISGPGATGYFAGAGYTPGSTYAVTYSTLPSGASLGTVTTTPANSAGQITGFTISGANSFPVNPLDTAKCPVTFTVASPPAIQNPIPVINANSGMLTNYPVARAKDFGCYEDDVHDDTLCLVAALNWSKGQGNALQLDSGKTYLVKTPTGAYQGGGDNGLAPVAATLTISVSAGSMTGCTLTNAGANLASVPIQLPSGISGGTITAALNSSTHQVSTCTASGSTTASGNFTAYAGQLCATGLPCTILAPDIASIPFILPSAGINVYGNGAHIDGGMPAITGACVHISAYAVSGTTATFTYSAPNCPLSANEPLTLEGFPITKALDGQQISVNSGFTSTTFSATVMGVTGSNAETGQASTIVDQYPWVPLFGCTNAGGCNGMQIRELYIDHAFAGFGNFGSGNKLEEVICESCGLFVQGENMQNDHITEGALSQIRSNVYAYIIAGGDNDSRAPYTGLDSASVINSYNLIDGLQLINHTAYFYRGSTVAQQNEIKQGLDSYFDQYHTMIEAANIFNPYYSWNPPNGVVRMTTQDQSALPVPDFMWRGIDNIFLAHYALWGRASNGVNVVNAFVENAANYPVILGANQNNSGEINVGTEYVGYCDSANTIMYGTSPCVNPYEPYNPELASAVLSLTGTNFYNIQISNSAIVQPVSVPWQSQNSTVNNAAGIPGPISASPNMTRNADFSTGDPVLYPSWNYSMNQNSPAILVYQADGAQIPSGSQPFNQSTMDYISGEQQFRGENWYLGDNGYLFYPAQGEEPTYAIQHPVLSGSTPLPSNVMASGLRISPNSPQGGNISSVTLTGGSMYPALPVTMAIQPSPQNTPGSTTSYYIPTCTAAAASGSGSFSATLATCPILGAGYPSAPPVIVNYPGGATFFCQSTTPSSGIPQSSCQLTNPGQGIVNCTATVANFGVGSGATFTPTCSNGQAVSLTVSGGSGYSNWWPVFVGNNGGSQATAVATVTGIDGQWSERHEETCQVATTQGYTIPANSSGVLPGMTGGCGNVMYNAGHPTATDKLDVGPLPGASSPALSGYALATAPGTLSIVIANPTNVSQTITAGTFNVFLRGADSTNSLKNAPTAQNPTLAVVAYGPLIVSFTTTASATDVVTLTGMAAGGHCSAPNPTNSAALAASQAGVTGKSTNSVTVTHAAIAGMTYDLVCWAF